MNFDLVLIVLVMIFYTIKPILRLSGNRFSRRGGGLLQTHKLRVESASQSEGLNCRALTVRGLNFKDEKIV